MKPLLETFYVIQRRSDGAFYNGQINGFTFNEHMTNGPTLYKSEAIARSRISAWLSARGGMVRGANMTGEDFSIRKLTLTDLPTTSA